MISELTLLQICTILLIGIFVGFSKTGVSSMGIFNAMLMTQIFPAKSAVGILLPMLIVADVMAVIYYRRNVVWKHLILLFPWVLVGIVCGYVVLLKVNNNQLQFILGALIASIILLQLVKDKLGPKIYELLPKSLWFTSIMGALAGFATMIGNVSGVIMAIYLFMKKLPKQEVIGTGAWFFLAVNVIKIFFYVHLGMITKDSLVLDTWTIPTILIGGVIGIKVINFIPQTWFQRIILLLGAVGAIRLML